MQKGMEDHELGEKGFQVEGTECVKIRRQGGAGALTEIYTKLYDWNMCM